MKASNKDATTGIDVNIIKPKKLGIIKRYPDIISRISRFFRRLNIVISKSDRQQLLYSTKESLSRQICIHFPSKCTHGNPAIKWRKESVLTSLQSNEYHPVH